MQFMETLPELASSANYGTEVIAPVWALRCARGTGPEISTKNQQKKSIVGSSGRIDDLSPDGKNKRWLLSLFELFEQLSSGKITSMELTETTPLDVYVHRRNEEEGYGLYCCSRHRLLALLMRQAAARNELHTVRCILRPKEDQSFWAWQWAGQYDGSDGLNVQPTTVGFQPLQNGSGAGSPNSSRFSLSYRGGSTPTSPRFAGASSRFGASPTASNSGASVIPAIADASPEQAVATEEQRLPSSPRRRGAGSGRGRGTSARGSGNFIPPGRASPRGRGSGTADKSPTALDRERGNPSSPAAGGSPNARSNSTGLARMEALSKTPTDDGAADANSTTANAAPAADVSTGDASTAHAAAAESAAAAPTTAAQERLVPTVRMELIGNE